MSKKETSGYKTFFLGLVGSCILIIGTTFILTWWSDVVSLFKGAVGIILAIGGMGVLYFLSKKD
ncbi:hypothetical protein ACFL49_01105 [Candidatus Omnitrophota bacterium]